MRIVPESLPWLDSEPDTPGRHRAAKPAAPALDALVEALPGAFLLFDHELTILELNHRAAQLLQQPRQQLRGQTLHQHFDPAGLRQLTAQRAAPSSCGFELGLRLELVRPQAPTAPLWLSLRQLDQSAQPSCWLAELHDPQRAPRHHQPSFNGRAQDLHREPWPPGRFDDPPPPDYWSETPRLEQAGDHEHAADTRYLRDALEQMHKLFCAFFQSTASGVLLFQPDGRIQAANQAFCSMLGYSEAELRQLLHSDLTCEEERRRELEQLQLLQCSATPALQLEKRYRHRDGSAVWALMSVALLREADGRPDYYLATVQNINTLKSHEAKLERQRRELASLTDHNPDAIGRFDSHTRCIFANPAMMYLLNSATPHPGKRLWELGFPANGVEQWQQAFDSAFLLHRRHTFEFEYGDGGETRTFLVKVVPETDKHGHVATVLAIARDVTALKAKETALQLRELELRASQETIRKLAAYNEKVRDEERKRIALEIHDELGQRLTALKMETSVAQYHARQKQMDALTDALGQIDRSIEDTVHLVRNVASNLHPAALSLGVQPAIEWLAEQFSRQHHIVCELSLPPVDVSLDEARAAIVFRIVQESLTNVARHAQASLVQVKLELTGQSELRLAVSDNGCGFRLHDPRPGEGFGLLSMQERALILGGQLHIDTEPGAGTRLTVTFPIAGGKP